MRTIVGTKDQARDFLTAHGTGGDETAGVLAAAEQFPGTWAYTEPPVVRSRIPAARRNVAGSRHPRVRGTDRQATPTPPTAAGGRPSPRR